MNLPFESSGGFYVQKNMFPAFWKLMVEIRASVCEWASLFCDLDVLGCGLETPIQGLLPPSTKTIPGHGKEGDSATKLGQTRNKGLVMTEWRVIKPRKLRTREAGPRLSQLQALCRDPLLIVGKAGSGAWQGSQILPSEFLGLHTFQSFELFSV